MKRVREFLYDRGGSFYFRRAVPPEAREAFGGRREVLISLKTRNLAEARLLMAPHLKDFHRRLTSAIGGPHPTPEIPQPISEPSRDEIEAAVRAWLAAQAERRPNIDRATARTRLSDLNALATVIPIGFEFGGDQPNLSTEWLAESIRDVRGWPIESGSAKFEHLLRVVARGQVEAARQETDEIHHRPRQVRDESFSAERYRLDEVRASEARTSPPVPLMDLFERYVSEDGPKPATVKAWKRLVQHLIDHLGHDDARKVSPDDIVAWKDKLLSEESVDGARRSPRTVRDTYLAAVRAVFRWGVRNRRISADPTAEIIIKVRKKTGLRKKDLTDAEAKIILAAALGPHSSRLTREHAFARRWVPWLCAYTGARVNEMTQLRRQDVFREEGIWTLRITPEAGSVKDDKARLVPIHSHIIAQGFLDALEGKKGPLFYNPARARGGSAGNPQYKKTGERLALWVREIGVVDPNVAPNHGWRHRFKTQARIAGMDPEVRHAIPGHSARSEGESYGDVPLTLMASEIEKLPRYNIPGAALPPARKRSKPLR